MAARKMSEFWYLSKSNPEMADAAIRDALERANFVVSAAAKRLGIYPGVIHKHIRKNPGLEAFYRQGCAEKSAGLVERLTRK